MGQCNPDAGCCPTCVTPNSCCDTSMPQYIHVSFIAGTDGDSLVVACEWSPVLGCWVGTWNSLCGTTMRICITCTPFGANPPRLDCPLSCNQPCCGDTTDATIDTQCNPFFSEWHMVIENVQNLCCPSPCRGSSSWTIQITL
jgi:hypothetical protein